MKTMVDVRWYDTGWTVRVGRVLLRWNRQDNYAGLELVCAGPDCRLVGGRSWRQQQPSTGLSDG